MKHFPKDPVAVFWLAVRTLASSVAELLGLLVFIICGLKVELSGGFRSQPSNMEPEQGPFKEDDSL